MMELLNGKTIVTIVTWVVLGLVSFAAIAGRVVVQEDWAIVAITLGPMLMAFITTIVLWEKELNPKNSQTNTDKAKRHATAAPEKDRLAMLLELMDEHERREFLDRLKAQVLDDMRSNDDGELTVNALTLESLLESEQEASYK